MQRSPASRSTGMTPSQSRWVVGNPCSRTAGGPFPSSRTSSVSSDSRTRPMGAPADASLWHVGVAIWFPGRRSCCAAPVAAVPCGQEMKCRGAPPVLGNRPPARPLGGTFMQRSRITLLCAFALGSLATVVALPIAFSGRNHQRDLAPDDQERHGLGSGFLIGNGLVLTNNHVVEIQDPGSNKFRPMDDIKVITDETSPAGAREYVGKVIGNDPKSDIALLKLEGEHVGELKGAMLGDSDALQVGDYVVAIGEPFGLQATVTSGIISAKERALGPSSVYSDFLQTDASINPGNSGGPLFNLRGEVIGVNTAIIGGANTIGFAIPIAVVKQILPQLEKNGRVMRGFLGVQPQPITQDMVDTLGLKSTQGAAIADVVKGSPADKAGVKPGDVVVSLSGKPVTDGNQLTRDVGAIPPGQTVKP